MNSTQLTHTPNHLNCNPTQLKSTWLDYSQPDMKPDPPNPYGILPDWIQSEPDYSWLNPNWLSRWVWSKNCQDQTNPICRPWIYTWSGLAWLDLMQLEPVKSIGRCDPYQLSRTSWVKVTPGPDRPNPQTLKMCGLDLWIWSSFLHKGTENIRLVQFIIRSTGKPNPLGPNHTRYDSTWTIWPLSLSLRGKWEELFT